MINVQTEKVNGLEVAFIVHQKCRENVDRKCCLPPDSFRCTAVGAGDIWHVALSWD